MTNTFVVTSAKMLQPEERKLDEAHYVVTYEVWTSRSNLVAILRFYP